MSSSNVAREYELVNTTSFGENEHTQDDGVWNNDNVSARRIMTRPTVSSRHRRKRLAVLTFVFIIVIIIVVSCHQGGGDDNVPAAAAEVSSSNQHNNDSTMTTHTANHKTPAPVSLPTASPTDPSATTPKQQYNCLDERIQNGVKLQTGHYICDHYKRYRFGLDDTGSLLYADDAFNMTVTIYNGTKGDYFQLLQDGRFVICNATDDVVWQEECSDHDVRVSNGCDICPYLHLHSGGTIVLNWINDAGEWKERNILHMYNLPQCHDHFFCYP